MARTGNANGARWRALVAATLFEYGTVCHLCLHAAAESADHLLPYSRGGPSTL